MPAKNELALNEHNDRLDDYLDKPVDFGTMHFTYRDNFGNINHIAVLAADKKSKTGQAKVLSVIPKSATEFSGIPDSLCNHMFMYSGVGYEELSRRLRDAVSSAYEVSAGDPLKVETAIRTITKNSDWKLARHNQPNPKSFVEVGQ